MKAPFFLLSFGMTFVCFTQENRPFATNSWFAAQAIFPLSKKWEVQADAGHRRCDEFVRQSRQTHLRTTLLYRLTVKLSVGPGFTWFGHVSEGKVTHEYRPFLQLSFRGDKKNWQKTMRLRNEWRIYPQRNEWRNRTRLQLGLRWNQLKRIQPYATLEGFITPGKTTVLESRITAGITFPIGRSALSLFYTEQQQSTIEYGQHIIGIQYNWSNR